jgi:hypothetical protein
MRKLAGNLTTKPDLRSLPKVAIILQFKFWYRFLSFNLGGCFSRYYNYSKFRIGKNINQRLALSNNLVIVFHPVLSFDEVKKIVKDENYLRMYI